MNIKQDIKNMLAESDLTHTALAKMAGINQCILSRFLNGDQGGLNTITFQKLWPFVYGDQRPQPKDTGDEAA